MDRGRGNKGQKHTNKAFESFSCFFFTASFFFFLKTSTVSPLYSFHFCSSVFSISLPPQQWQSKKNFSRSFKLGTFFLFNRPNHSRNYSEYNCGRSSKVLLSPPKKRDKNKNDRIIYSVSKQISNIVFAMATIGSPNRRCTSLKRHSNYRQNFGGY